VASTRDLRLLAGATFLSSAGDLLALLVLALHVHELTGSGLAVSALFRDDARTHDRDRAAGWARRRPVRERAGSGRRVARPSARCRRARVQHGPSRDPRARVAADCGQRVQPAGRVHARAGGGWRAARDRGDRRRRSRALRGLCRRAAAGRGAGGAGPAASAAGQRGELRGHRGGGERDACTPPGLPEHGVRALARSRRLLATAQRSCPARHDRGPRSARWCSSRPR
jgi:hypothetical protein